MAADPGIHHRGVDRRLYIWVAIFIPVIVLTGFARTYYLKGLLNGPATARTAGASARPGHDYVGGGGKQR